MSALLSSIDGSRHLSRKTLERYVVLATEKYPEETERLLRRLRTLDSVERPCPCCVHRGKQQCAGLARLQGVCRQCHKMLQKEIRDGRATEAELVRAGLREERQ